MLLLTHAETGQYINKTKLQIQNSSLPSSVSMWPTRVRLQGRIQDFFLGGGALVSCSSSTPINHIVFFGCCRIPVVLETAGHLKRGVRTPCTLPLDPPLGYVVRTSFPASRIHWPRRPGKAPYRD